MSKKWFAELDLGSATARVLVHDHDEAWIGGHSPRAPGAGDSGAVLRDLLTPGAHPAGVEGFRITGEADDVRWPVRLHERSTTVYRMHLLAAEVSSRTAP